MNKSFIFIINISLKLHASSPPSISIHVYPLFLFCVCLDQIILIPSIPLNVCLERNSLQRQRNLQSSHYKSKLDHQQEMQTANQDQIFKLHDWGKTKELQPQFKKFCKPWKIDPGALGTLYRVVHHGGIDRALGTLYIWQGLKNDAAGGVLTIQLHNNEDSFSHTYIILNPVHFISPRILQDLNGLF